MATILYGAYQPTWEGFVESLSALSIIKAVAVFLGVSWLLAVSSSSRVYGSPRHMALILLLLCALIFLPNMVIAFTGKYQEWVRFGSKAYLYSHFSYFAWIGLGVFCLLIMAHRWQSRILVGFLATLSAIGSLATDASNRDITQLQNNIARRWDTMNLFLSSEAYQILPENATILFVDPTLTGSESEEARYWSMVANARTGRNVSFTSDPQVAFASEGRGYYLYLYDEPKAENQYALFAPITINSSSWATRQLLVFPNSENSRLGIGGTFSCAEVDCLASVLSNDQPTAELFNRTFAVNAGSIADPRGVRTVQLDTTEDLDVRTVTVDFARNPKPTFAPVRIFPSSGFRGWETDGTTRLNWASVDSAIEIQSTLDRTITVMAEFWIVGGDEREVIFSRQDGEVLARASIGSGIPGPVRIPIDVSNGATTITLHSSKPALYGGGQDGVAFQLLAVGLRTDDRLVNRAFE